MRTHHGRATARWTTALLAAALVVVASAAGTSAGSRPPQVTNGECVLTTQQPIRMDGPARVAVRAQLNCRHLSAADAQVQLWRSAGAKGAAGDILLTDGGWHTWTLSRGKGAARADDAPCTDLPATGSYYLRARVRSSVPPKTAPVTSAWVRGKARSLAC